jgi:hypothetical protein
VEGPTPVVKVLQGNMRMGASAVNRKDFDLMSNRMIEGAVEICSREPDIPYSAWCESSRLPYFFHGNRRTAQQKASYQRQGAFRALRHLRLFEPAPPVSGFARG